jgi:hypothetical protein
MQKLTRADLFTLEAYAENREAFRSRVINHKKPRKVSLGDHITLLFEDRLTMQYQIQEMLRVERIFESAAIEEELAAYNPLIPDGYNLKATLLIEYADVAERKQALANLIGIEKKIWIRIGNFDSILPIADEDLERENREKTSSVHFLRFEFTPDMVAAARDGADIALGVDHSHYSAVIDMLPEASRAALVKDFD